MIFTGNPLIIKPGMVFFMHMILMDSKAQLAMNLGETYLVTETGNERLGKTKAGFGHFVALFSSLMTSLPIKSRTTIPKSFFYSLLNFTRMYLKFLCLHHNQVFHSSNYNLN